ncbi:MAG TPA: 3-phosphoshikimate 1-carboxyvinyltransferase [Chlamydiales bacterium]|nr:3-phosphoshikimate 1-carboxyvinyltransferase [Chlamydiales bacterium]
MKKNIIIKPASIAGTFFLPPSKSHTMRAILLASLANGRSLIENYLHSPDTEAMIEACESFGAEIIESKDQLMIDGVKASPTFFNKIIDSKNSGQVFRFIAAIASMTNQKIIITGDHSIQTRRVIEPLLKGLQQLGAVAYCQVPNRSAPIVIKGPLNSGTVCVEGADSQVVSALLMLAVFLEGTTKIIVKNPGEKPWVDLTLYWLAKLGVRYQKSDYYNEYIVEGRRDVLGFDYTVASDLSSLAFPLIAAIISNQGSVIHHADIFDVQGDKKILKLVSDMGALWEYDEKKNDLTIFPHLGLKGIEMDINDCIDALPALATLACFAEGKTTIKGAAIARKKESNRILSMKDELTKMGAKIVETEDGLEIYGSKLYGASLKSYEDHRIAMALFIAASYAESNSVLEGVECIQKSFPNFLSLMTQNGAVFEESL